MKPRTTKVDLSTKTAAELRKLAKQHHVKQTTAAGKTKNKKQLKAGLRAVGAGK